mmetsp:Transcript_48561/g.140706  ORF Transcript_48561/g.140706 Transcript_48561/m.140706 type:complete len:294 (-) Transcript_48561:107-988(-)
MTKEGAVDCPEFQDTEDANTAWERQSHTQVFSDAPDGTFVASPEPGMGWPPKLEGALRCVCISDTHGRHALVTVPPGDILIHAGDFTMCGADFEVEEFAAWLKTLPHMHKVIVAGNHDETCDAAHFVQKNRGSVDAAELEAICKRAKDCLLASGCVYLEDSAIEIDGISFYGSPHQPEFNDWAFNLPRGPPLREKWAQIPANVDVLVTHGPPLGRGDEGDKYTGKQHWGCVDLLTQVQSRIRPRFHVFGHVHEGYGTSCDGTTVFINAASLDKDYTPTNPAIVFDIFPKQAGK